MLKVKLFQRGKRGQRTYRLVVAEAKSKRDGKFTDSLGFWNPHTKKLKIDQKKLADWQKKGAQLTSGVRKLIEKEK
ncbi:30S ribosomal protein S16 [Candidatus Shapirobacteria bacterium]|nr:30S ribosomal protein S16 [Candidatus Shapirobacteria bacterium]